MERQTLLAFPVQASVKLVEIHAYFSGIVVDTKGAYSHFIPLLWHFPE